MVQMCATIHKNKQNAEKVNLQFTSNNPVAYKLFTFQELMDSNKIPAVQLLIERNYIMNS